jgi:hypothetical protein
MLIALIIALIFGVSGGAESEFASYIPNIKKEIRQNVPEKARKDTLMLLVKDYERTLKKYDKEKKKLRKDINKAGTDRTVSTEVFLEHYDDYFNTRIQVMSQLISYRLSFQEKLSQYELLMITEKALQTSKKADRKENKQVGKVDKQLKAVFRDINEIILKHIEDTTKTEIISAHLREFENTIYSYVDEATSLSMERKVMLNKQDASREEIDEMFERSNLLIYKASRDYAILREELIKNTNESEWKAINKELKVFLKS